MNINAKQLVDEGEERCVGLLSCCQAKGKIVCVYECVCAEEE